MVKYNNIGAIAKNHGMTIKELADVTGISRWHLEQVSAGRVKITVDDVLAICKALQIRPDDIAIFSE